jgi:hypothetical protein
MFSTFNSKKNVKSYDLTFSVDEWSEISNLLKEDLDNILNQSPTTIEIH